MADRTRSSIDISAGKSEIMAALADFPAYPKWLEGIKEAEVLSTQDGGRADRVRFRLETGPIRDTYVLTYVWEGDDSVRWDMTEPGRMVTKMSGSYLLADMTDMNGSTEVTYELTVEAGLLRIGAIRRRTEKMITEMALRDLKRAVEKPET